MQNAITNLDSGTIIVNKKGKALDPDALLKIAEEAAGKIKIGEKSDKITNQDSRYWSVEGSNSDVEHKKGIVFLGNEGIDLKQGDYISIDEFLAALNEYIIMKPNENEISNNLSEKEEKVVVRVIHKYKNKLSRLLVISAVLLILASGIRVKDNIKTIDVPIESKEQIVRVIEQENLEYDIYGINTLFKNENISDSKTKIASELKIGDDVPLQNGDTLYESSELTGNKVEIGKGIRQAGNYQISGVSIVYNGHMYAWYVDPSINNPGFEIGKFINETIEKKNLDLDQIEIRLHMGNSSNYTRTGWIDISELIKEDMINKQVISESSKVASTYNGTIDNFTDSTITFDTLDGPVTINVVDSNGNLLKSGTIVIGSDGKEYKIGNLDLSTLEVTKEETITTTTVEERQVTDGKKLTWNIQDCSLELLLAPLLGAIAASIATKKKNKEFQQNPTLFKFENEEEYLKFKEEFEKAKEEYEQKSGFKKMLKRLFYREEVDLLQKLTQEQIIQLYNVIRNCNTQEYSYSPKDKIDFINGKIIVTLSDGNKKDITHIIIPLVASIGEDNKIDAEGLLKEEIQNEIRKR